VLYFLEYDLRKQRDYQKLYDELKSFNARRVLKSLWCFERIDTDVTRLRDYFRRFLDQDDGLIVMEVGTAWSGWNLEGHPHNAVAA
jgi:hypothetical protein